MGHPFHEKLAFMTKALSLTRADVAKQLGGDKSLVGRWMTGGTMPSAHNLARLTAMFATHRPGFSLLDWERELDDIGDLVGVPRRYPAVRRREDAQWPVLFGPLADLEAETLATTERRGPAYEGIFRNTRPFSDMPGKYLHDYVFTRMEPDGLTTWTRCIGRISVKSRFIALHSQVFFAGKEVTTGLPVFGIINGSNGGKVVRYEGILLYSAHDGGHTPFATPFISERVADLTGDREADEARFAELAEQAGIVPEGQVPPEIQAHLIKDVGPSAFAQGGELLLKLSPGNSLAMSYIPF